MQKDATHNNYWYYQVVEGQLLLSCDVYGSIDEQIANSSFHHIVISAENLAKLFHQGYNKEALMMMSYSEVKNILKTS